MRIDDGHRGHACISGIRIVAGQIVRWTQRRLDRLHWVLKCASLSECPVWWIWDECVHVFWKGSGVGIAVQYQLDTACLDPMNQEQLKKAIGVHVQLRPPAAESRRAHPGS
jgi:hypothetical protein